MRIPIAVVGHARSRAELQAFADATCLVNRVMMRERGTFLPLYESGIRYRPERRGGRAPGVERFQTVDSSYELGFDDCDGLGPARAAELLNAGVWARPWVVRSSSADSAWHVVVLRRRADGTVYVEDPSARLGMLDPRNEDVEGIEVDIVHRARMRGDAVQAFVGAVTEDHTFGALATEYLDDNDARPRRAARRRATLKALRKLGTQTAALTMGPQAAIIDEAVKASAAAVNARARIEHARIEGRARRLRA